MTTTNRETEMDDQGKHLCLYHADADGACSAWVVQRLHPDAECVAVQYGEPVPLDLAEGRSVYVVDFSWPVDPLEELLRQSARLMVIDHHKTARDELEELAQRHGAALDEVAGIAREELPEKGFGGLRVVFDPDRSGAGLTWDTLFPDEPRPWFVDYVEDRDLWRFALPESKIVNAYLSSLPRGPEGFSGEYITNAGAFRTHRPWDSILDQGRAVLGYRARLVESMVGRARVGRLPGYECSVAIPITNAPVLQSEVAHELAKGQPFAAVYWDDEEGHRVWSLRSDDDGVDVSEIAARYGGGGHKHAAGFKE